jgi:hypothetical protein
MAHRSHIIATACEVVLDRRVRGDEAKVQAARERVGGTPADMAAAEFWCVWGIAVVEQLADGEWQLRDLITRHRVALVTG